jgi:hypothetical protein
MAVGNRTAEQRMFDQKFALLEKLIVIERCLLNARLDNAFQGQMLDILKRFNLKLDIPYALV